MVKLALALLFSSALAQSYPADSTVIQVYPGKANTIFPKAMASTEAAVCPPGFTKLHMQQGNWVCWRTDAK